MTERSRRGQSTAPDRAIQAAVSDVELRAQAATLTKLGQALAQVGPALAMADQVLANTSRWQTEMRGGEEAMSARRVMLQELEDHLAVATAALEQVEQQAVTEAKRAADDAFAERMEELKKEHEAKMVPLRAEEQDHAQRIMQQLKNIEANNDELARLTAVIVGLQDTRDTLMAEIRGA